MESQLTDSNAAMLVLLALTHVAAFYLGRFLKSDERTFRDIDREVSEKYERAASIRAIKEVAEQIIREKDKQIEELVRELRDSKGQRIQ